MARVVPLVLLVAAAAAAACTSDDDAAPTAKTKLTVVVLEEPLRLDDASDRPIAGADVAFDPPAGGARLTAITDAEGRATFDVDLGAGPGVVTIYSADHVSYSALDVTTSEVTLVVPRLDRAADARTVALSGALSGRAPTSATVDVSASQLDRVARNVTTTDVYSLRVVRGQPFFVLGHEQLASGVLVKSFRFDVEAKDADARLDIDLTNVPALPTRTSTLRVERPASMALDATLFADVESADSSLVVGVPTSMDANAVTLAVAETDLGGERPVTRATLTTRSQARSVRIELGVVADGTTWNDFLAPPTIVEASRFKTDPIPVENFPDGADLRVEMIAGGKLGWILTGPRGGLRSKTITLPPSFKVDFPAIVAVNVGAQLDPIDLGRRRVLYRRAAFSADVILHR